MTLKDILTEVGLTEDQIGTVTERMKAEKIYTAGEENLDIRFGKLKSDHDALVTKEAEGQKLIAELQKATKGQEQIQTKIAEYEATIARQTEELKQARTESALKVGLLSGGAKPTDIDYLIYRIQHTDEWNPELTEDGEVKGLTEKIERMKTAYPTQFESASEKQIEEKKLEVPDQKTTVTAEEFGRMGYQSRAKLYAENPEAYKALTEKK